MKEQNLFCSSGDAIISPIRSEVTSTLKLETYHQSFIKVIIALTHIDNTLAFWPYENPNALESDLLTKPDTLGSSIHQTLQYFNEFCINKELSMLYIHCLISFNMEYNKFMQSVTVMLEDILANIYK